MKDYNEPKGFAHLGSGWHYPFRHDADGNVEISEHVASVRSSVRFILDTYKGEIFMTNTGTRLREVLFMEQNDIFFALAEEYTREALREQEPRVGNIQISFGPKQGNPNAVTMFLSYDVVSTSIRDTIQYDLIRRERL